MGLVTYRLNRASRSGNRMPPIQLVGPRGLQPGPRQLLHPVVEWVGQAGTLVGMGRTDQAIASVRSSAQLFEDACGVIPGGVNSPVRAFTAVGGTPRFTPEPHGGWLTDAAGTATWTWSARGAR